MGVGAAIVDRFEKDLPEFEDLNGLRIRISGCPKVARSLASSTSAIIASSKPAPNAGPSTAITSGSSLSPSALNSRLKAAIIPSACSGRCSPTSAPAENARPVAVKATALSDRS